TSYRRMMAQSPHPWTTHRAGRGMFCSPIQKQSTFQAATWPFCEPHCVELAALTSASGSPATTSIFVGVYKNADGGWASVPRRRYGIIVETRCAPICGSRRGMGRQKPFWRRNGRRNTIPSDIRAGLAVSTAQECLESLEQSHGFISDSGGALHFNVSTKGQDASNLCSLCRSGTWRTWPWLRLVRWGSLGVFCVSFCLSWRFRRAFQSEMPAPARRGAGL